MTVPWPNKVIQILTTGRQMSTSSEKTQLYSIRRLKWDIKVTQLIKKSVPRKMLGCWCRAALLAVYWHKNRALRPGLLKLSLPILTPQTLYWSLIELAIHQSWTSSHECHASEVTASEGWKAAFCHATQESNKNWTSAFLITTIYQKKDLCSARVLECIML